MSRGLRLSLAVLAVAACGFVPAKAATPDEANLASQIFAAINEKRSSPLTFDASLAASAQNAAEYNRAHVGESGCDDACHTAGGNEHFEIVYWNAGPPPSADQVVNFWMSSPQHKTNMLSSGATAGGVGVVIDAAKQRAWAITWFNGGDTAPANVPPKTTTTKAPKPTPTTASGVITTAATTATTVGTETTTSSTDTTLDTSTTTTSTTEPSAVTLVATNASDGGSNTGLLVAAAAVVLAGAGGIGFALVRRRREESGF